MRLAAQEDDEIRALAGLRAQRLVRDDQGRSRGNPGDAVQYLLRNDDPIERGLCINDLGINGLGINDLGVVRIRQHRLGIAITAPARAAIWLNRAAV